MKLILSILVTLFCGSYFAAPTNSPNPLPNSPQISLFRNTLSEWEGTQGNYVYEGISSLILGTPYPARPISVHKTAFELLHAMSDEKIHTLEQIMQANREEGNTATYTNEWLNYLRASRCDYRKGRSYGDPHMRTFNGKSYDFQLSGNFLLAASQDGRFSVQSQMKRANQNVSLNVAVAVNINGDRLEFYANQRSGLPTLSFMNNLQVDPNNPLRNKIGIFNLPNGGILERQAGKIIIKAPTGEQVAIKQANWMGDDFLNVIVYVSECEGPYRGLLGIEGDMRSDMQNRNRVIAHAGTPNRVQHPVREVDNSSTANRRQPGDVRTPEDEGNRRGEDDNDGHRTPTLFSGNTRNVDAMKTRAEENQRISNSFGKTYKMEGKKSLFSKQINQSKYDQMPVDYDHALKLDDAVVQRGLKKARAAGVPEEDLYAAVYDYGVMKVEPKKEHYNFYPTPDKKLLKSAALNKTKKASSLEQKEVVKTPVKLKSNGVVNKKSTVTNGKVNKPNKTLSKSPTNTTAKKGSVPSKTTVKKVQVNENPYSNGNTRGVNTAPTKTNHYKTQTEPSRTTTPKRTTTPTRTNPSTVNHSPGNSRNKVYTTSQPVHKPTRQVTPQRTIHSTERKSTTMPSHSSSISHPSSVPTSSSGSYSVRQIRR